MFYLTTKQNKNVSTGIADRKIKKYKKKNRREELNKENTLFIVISRRGGDWCALPLSNKIFYSNLIIDEMARHGRRRANGLIVSSFLQGVKGPRGCGEYNNES